MLAHGEHAGDNLLLMADFIGAELTHEGFKAVYVITYSWVGVQALYIAYFAHLIARVVYLTKEWKY